MSWPAAVAIIAVAIIIAWVVVIHATAPERYRLKLEREKTRRHRDWLDAHESVALEMARRPITEDDMRRAGIIAYSPAQLEMRAYQAEADSRAIAEVRAWRDSSSGPYVGQQGPTRARRAQHHGWRCTCIVCQDS